MNKLSEEYFKVNTKIIDNYGKHLPSSTIQTYIGLLRHADGRGVVIDQKTQKQWADAIGVGKTTLARSIHILQEEGLLKIIKPRNPTDCCGYIVIDPGEAVSSSRKRRLFINYKQGKRSDI
jgi:hypothetical protein